MSFKLKFYGAAQSVTGSKTLLEISNKKILIDCGMYQGLSKAQMKELKPNKLLPSDVDLIFLTHAHLDHSGYLPIFVNEGFRGDIFCTKQTKELVEIILNDSFNIQESQLRSKEISQGLFTQDDIALCLELMKVKPVDHIASLFDFSFKFYPAGHILGAVNIVFSHNGEKIGFSGDIGRKKDLLHTHPVFPEELDTLILESTYGDREHKDEDYKLVLKKNIERVISTQGVLLIPAFAIARTQILMHALYETFLLYPDLEIPTFVDSPMAIKATDVYYNNCDELKITKEHFDNIFKKIKLVRFGNDNDKLKKAKPPFILISSSGMISGGRVMGHFERYALKDQNTILLTGFQGPNTIGELLASGHDEVVVKNKPFKVKAYVDRIESLSAHADHTELLEMLKGIKNIKKVILNHGEDSARDVFKKELEDKLELKVELAQLDLTFNTNK